MANTRTIDATTNPFFKKIHSEPEIVMTDNHRNQLEIHRPELIRSMNPTEVIDELRSRQVLTPRDAEEITGAGGSSAQNAKLLDYLRRKPDCAYGKFCAALRTTGQKHLEKLLRCDVLTVSDLQLFSYQNTH